MKRLTHFPDIDIHKNHKIYDAYINDFHMEDGWLKGNKEYNFFELVKLAKLTGVPIRGKKCLDVGCGTGDLSALLRKHGMRDYIGIDIYKPSLSTARKRYPNETFVLGDFLAGDVTGVFDYAFCSGALTVKLTTENNYDLLYSVVGKMWEMSRIGLAFNVLTDEDRFQDPSLFFYKPEKVEKVCRAIEGRSKIIITPTQHVAQIHVYMYR
jgi:SAM-dependent methyltransferase